MTFAAVGSAVFQSSSSWSLTPHTVNDFILAEVINASNSTVFCTGLSSSNITWIQLLPVYTGVSVPGTCTVFLGLVTSASAATVTVTWSGTAPAAIRIGGQEFSSTAGNWALDIQGHIDTSGSSSTWASLTPHGAGELYFGYCLDSGTASAGSTSGYTYDVDAHGNGMAFNPACASAAQAPAWADAGQELGVMILVREVAWSVITTAAANGSWNNNFTTPDGNYLLNVDAFNYTSGSFVSQYTWGNSESDWGATVTVNNGANPVISYPDVENTYAQVPLGNFQHIWATWAQTMPSASSGFTGEAMFDCWLNGAFAGAGDEVSIFVDNQGVFVGPSGDTVIGQQLQFNGMLWTAYQRVGASPPDFIFVPYVNLPSGTLDLLPFFNWLVTNGYLANPSTLQAIEFGWETVQSGGQPAIFQVTSYSVSAQSQVVGGGR